MTPTAKVVMKRLSPTKVNWPVFAISGALILGVAAWACLAPKMAENVLARAVTWISVNLGWFYIALATVVVVFVIAIAAGRWGRVRLGPDHARPQYSFYSWSAMLFAAGIGVDLLFFSVAEPVYQYYMPPEGSGETVQAARDAIVFTIFHYGITGWAMYALMGICFGYFAYRKNLPLAVRSALYPLIGRRIHGAAGHAVDIAAVLGTVFGVATSLGIGVIQLNYGLTVLFGIPEGRGAQAALILIAIGTATVSAVSGVDKGIKRLSELNVALAIFLVGYVLLTGRTTETLSGIVMNVGDYISGFVGLTLNTYAYTDSTQWLSMWTLFFWAWWVAWAPFVGLFLARISKGRTLRQFVFGTLSLPLVFVASWLAVFGNAAIQRLLSGDQAFGKLTMDHPERGFYQLLESFPNGIVVVAIASVIGLLLYITSADSAALVTADLSSRDLPPDADGPRWSRIFWAVTTGALTLGMLIVGGITALQNATLIIGLPFAVVIILMMFGLVKALKYESHLTASRQRISPPAAVERSWVQRLSYAVTYTDLAGAQRFVRDVAHPALNDVAEQTRELGLESFSVLEDGESPSAKLTVSLDGEDFSYEVAPVQRNMPSFAMAVSPEEDIYFRLEVFSGTGARDRDIAGFTRDQVIADVLNDFEAHLKFLESCDRPGLVERLLDVRDRMTALAERFKVAERLRIRRR